jgi:hypothetical protein
MSVFVLPLTDSVLFFGDTPDRRGQRQDGMDFRSSAGRAVNIELPAETIGNDVVDDMQAEPSVAALAAVVKNGLKAWRATSALIPCSHRRKTGFRLCRCPTPAP